MIPVPAPQRRVRWFRRAAVGVLILGCLAAGAVYWFGSRENDLSDDPAMLGFNRATDHQLTQLYGSQGQVMENLDNWLKQPGARAFLVLVGAGVIALGCFQFSRVLAAEAEAGAATPPNSPTR